MTPVAAQRDAFFDPAGGGAASALDRFFWLLGHPMTHLAIAGLLVAAMLVALARTIRPGLTSFESGFAVFGATLGAITILFAGATVATAPSVLGAALVASIALACGTVPIALVDRRLARRERADDRRLATSWTLGVLVLAALGGAALSADAIGALDRRFFDAVFLTESAWRLVGLCLLFSGFALVLFIVPRRFGRRVPARAGVIHFWSSFAGVALVMLFDALVGLDGMPRRYVDQNAALAAAEVWAMIGGLIAPASVVGFGALIGYAALFGRRIDAHRRVRRP